ncbi:DUF4277 domain-containing protein [Streptomyces laurentii]|uniref:DUF4277 domain-containing protein n=1 Tax=Streptomyces laurentii TaxID=39478 RepID=UPI00369BB95C
MTKRLGALPVVAEFPRRLRVAGTVDGLCPVRDLALTTHGEVIEALVANRLTSPRPLVRMPALTWHFDQDVLDIQAKADGWCALITNQAPAKADAAAVFLACKGQSQVERRYRELRGPLAVAPVFLHDNTRQPHTPGPPHHPRHATTPPRPAGNQPDLTSTNPTDATQASDMRRKGLEPPCPANRTSPFHARTL